MNNNREKAVIKTSVISIIANIVLAGFKAIITINSNGKFDGKVIDLEVNEEYLGLRTEMMGEFAS